MTHSTKGIDSPGVEPVPPPEDLIMIGGRAETWLVPAPRTDDELFEPTIVRGRE